MNYSYIFYKLNNSIILYELIKLPKSVKNFYFKIILFNIMKDFFNYNKLSELLIN